MSWLQPTRRADGAWSLPEPLRARIEARRSLKTDEATLLTVRAVIASRALVWIAALATIALFGRNVQALANFDSGHLTEPFRAHWLNTLLAPGARWDSAWYLQIAHVGYFSRQSSAFFPLYPVLIGLAGGSYASALILGLLVSIMSFGAGLYLVYRLALLDLDEAQARTAMWLVALFPTAFYFSSVYTESLFLALSVGAVYAARLDRWGWAAVLAGLAGAARSNGLLIAVPLALIYLYGPRAGAPTRISTPWWRPRYRLTRSALWLLLVPLGLIAFLTYLGIAHGAPLAPFQVQAFWNREFAGPFGAVVRLVGALPGDVTHVIAGTAKSVGPGDPTSWAAHDLIDLGFLAFALAGLVFSWRRLPRVYSIYAVIFLAQVLSEPLSSEPLASFSRYILPMFPLFLGWGAVLARRPRLARGVHASSALLLAVFSGLWAFWAWVA